MSRKKTNKYPALDFRYGDNWEKISRQSRSLCPVCCYCLVKPATLVHHTQYVDEEGELLLDRVELGDSIYSVCDGCHRVVHAGKNYLVDKRGKQFNRNRQHVVDRLRFGYLVIKDNV